MKSIKIDLDRDIAELKVKVLADLHIGDPLCDIKQITNEISEIVKDNNMYVILNGDIINNAIKTSVSDVYGETMTPMQELELAIELLRPIKDKILCINTGNHERRTYRETSIDLMKLLSRELGVEDRYTNESAIIFVRFGEMFNGHKETNNSGNVRKLCYSFFVTHGAKGGSNAGGKINAMMGLHSIIDTDIYIHSHTHIPAVVRGSFFRTDVRNSSYGQVDKLFVNNGATLNYGGYGEESTYSPNSKAIPIIYLSGREKLFRARV